MSQHRGDFPGSPTGRESPPPRGNDATRRRRVAEAACRAARSSPTQTSRSCAAPRDLLAATHLSREVRTFRTSSGRRALPPCIRSKYDLSYQDGARGQHEPMTPQGRSLEQVLVALGTNEHVASALRRYPQRDTAIEALEDDVDHQRRGLVADLRAVMRERSALQVAGRMRRDAYLTR
jgi:hypothetical protein